LKEKFEIDDSTYLKMKWLRDTQEENDELDHYNPLKRRDKGNE
jgi:hypothetical protein